MPRRAGRPRRRQPPSRRRQWLRPPRFSYGCMTGHARRRKAMPLRATFTTEPPYSAQRALSSVTPIG
eukprot:5458778-Lingulodinium_polyedra.AAC.1